MTLNEIANELVAGCREGRARENLKKLYAADAVSVEAADMGNVAKGVPAIAAKHDWWEGAHTIHAATVEGPFPHGDDRFAVLFDMDVTNKESGQRMQMREIAVYHVADGKIAREEFFYST